MSTDGTFFHSFPPSLAETSPLLRIKAVGVCWVRRWSVHNSFWRAHTGWFCRSDECTSAQICCGISCYCPETRDLLCVQMICVRGVCFPHSGYEMKLSSGEGRNLTGKQEGIGGDLGQWFPFPHSFGSSITVQQSSLRNAFGGSSNPNGVVIWWHCDTHTFTNMKWYSQDPEIIHTGFWVCFNHFRKWVSFFFFFSMLLRNDGACQRGLRQPILLPQIDLITTRSITLAWCFVWYS